MDSAVSGTYAISFMHFAGIPLATTAPIIFVSRVGDVLGVLLSGPLADLCKRRMVAYFAIGLATLLSYLSARAIRGKRIPLVMLLQFLITFFRNRNLARASPDPDLGELPDEIQILRHGHIL